MPAKLHRMLVVTFVLSVVIVSSAYAWWSGWYSPNFYDNGAPDGQYAPTSYRHGQGDSSYAGGTEWFGSQMQWDSAQAANVQYYSNHEYWFGCWWVPMYYTHDHSDMSGKLHLKAYYSNFPSPKYDWDDDDGNGWYDEGEVVSLDKSFPAAYSTYEFDTYWERKMPGSGYLYETPQLSGKPWCMGEYNTWRYDDHPQSLNYYTYGSAQANLQLPEASKITQSIRFTTTLPTELGVLNMAVYEGKPFLKAELTTPTIETRDDLHNYVEKIKETVVPTLRKVSVTKAFTIVTLKNPVHPNTLADIIGGLDPASTEVIKAIYIDRNDPNAETNVWTMQVNIEKGDNIQELLEPPDFSERGFGTDVHQPETDGNELEYLSAKDVRVDLELRGIVAIGVWLPLDTIDRLNNHELVFLADASPTYARVMAAESNLAKEMHLDRVALPEDKQPDGLSSSIIVRPSFNDLYAEIQELLLKQ